MEAQSHVFTLIQPKLKAAYAPIHVIDQSALTRATFDA